MRVLHDRLWPMFHEIREYARKTGLKIASSDSVMGRSFGFETVCSEFRPEHRHWTITISKTSMTANKFDCFLDGERVQHPEQERIMRRYLKLLATSETRIQLADALSTGRHPEKPEEPKPAVEPEQLKLAAVG